ncbi:MAG: DUF2157 domain-containing protein, partial [Synechococcaceae cyanobacterium SM2_3_2]|nr:DUF2157 domain-containing protein [Synechococcaceae cyanobacterium SM2_3_2]
MADDTFRRRLDQVLDQWVSEGLIESPQKDRIRDYYKLDDLARIASNRFTFLLLLLGGILVGVGGDHLHRRQLDLDPSSRPGIGGSG